ncbi:efflux RND transporter periplasmic adaptor subunit [Frateuria sp. STR12]|uniref:efflux RND transporter periplasmic adaptor subunit n=1 Tax=Frateuria hangzhouensis TaxID=2995589 RepID=UPI002260DD61|nr:efflux RND transporter periplasmic adaptor subunit [Frateuria sp. STR12]MCX7515068.1 efflux RND transporter periplasmic adaptor subunit [Frateuria sp. STR12]
MTPKKFLLVLAVLALVAVGVRFAWHHDAPASEGKPAARAVPVQVAAARQGSLDLSLNLVGRAEAWSSVALRAQVSGQLESLAFQPGSRVKKGQLLARLDTRLLQARLDQARGAVARDRAQLDKAEADSQRYADMLAKGYVSKADFDTYQANLAVAQATLQGDRAAQELAQANLDYARIVAPFDGVTGAPLVWPGAQVSAQDTDIVVLNQVQPIRVAFSLPEASLGAVRAALARGPVTVRATVPGDPRSLAGTLQFVDNAVDHTTGTIVLKARFDNPDLRLTPGQFVQVILPTTRIESAVSVPVIALQSSSRGSFVFVVGADNTVAQRYVTPGPVAAGQQVIAKGLNAGERVVTEGQMLLVDGTKVHVAS